MTKEKVLIFSAPSGSGKTTIVKHLLKQFPCLEFSISATSRAPRGTEADGKDYYFMSTDQFKARVAAGDFLEWEEVYSGSCYGTLRSEIERIWAKGNVVVFDVDVKGGVNIKRLLGEKALSVFVMPPSIAELGNRLVSRATDTPEAIAKRVEKAAEEMTYAPHFDVVLVNDNLEKAYQEAEKVVEKFIFE